MRSVALNEYGDTLLAEGDHGEALKAYEENLAIAWRLAAADPGHAEWARDLIVSHVKVAQAANDDTVAREHYAAALAVAEELATGGRLAAADVWMVEDLRQRHAAADGR